MKKILILSILVATFAVAGCADDYDSGEAIRTPNETIFLFKDSFESNNMDQCYSLMSKDYRKKHDADEFLQTVNGYKKDEVDKYEFVEVKDFASVEGTATVDIVYNEKSDYINHWSNDKEETIKLVKESGEWKFKEFPIELI